MPKKTFSAGETLLASDVNTYLMNQAVMVFDDASARTTAIPSPGEGMVTYLKDVDLVQVWDGSEWDEVSGGGSITVASTAPSGPEEGDLWFNDVSGKTFVYYTDSDGSQWVEVGQAGGLASASVVTSSTRPGSPIEGQVIFETDTGAALVWDGDSWEAFSGGGSIEISATAPSSPDDGDLWWDSDNGNLYIYYDDGDSQQWVAANGPQVFVGTTAPAGYQGQLWFDSTEGKMYVYYDDGSSAQWVSAIGGQPSGSVLQVVSTTKTDTFSASVASGSKVTVTGLQASITPSSTASKVLIFLDTNGGSSSTAGWSLIINRDGSPISVGDSVGSRTPTTSGGTDAGGDGLNSPGVCVLDTPNTVSSVTYTVEIMNQHSTSTQTLTVNRSANDADAARTPRAASRFVLMEIAG